MERNTVKVLSQLSQTLAELNNTKSPLKAFVGFDGFVDYIKKAVKQRRGQETIY
jgi:hypothetical protein